MTIGTTYLRISPRGDKTFITIETQREKEHHEDLEREGFIYQAQAVSSPQVCISCDG